jgi:hypothetical protein
MALKRAPVKSLVAAVAFATCGFLGLEYLTPILKHEPWSWFAGLVFMAALYLGAILFLVSLVYWLAAELAQSLAGRGNGR